MRIALKQSPALMQELAPRVRATQRGTRVPSGKQVYGQGALPGMEHPDKFRLDSQVSFAWIMNPEQWSMNPADYSDITPQMTELMTPDNLRPSLIDVSADSPCAVGYEVGLTRDFTRVALTPTEYGLISRNVGKLGEASVNKTLASRPMTPDFIGDELAAQRSGAHTIKGYIERMETYVGSTLEVDIERLKSFEEYVGHKNLRRSKGINMRTDIEWIREHIFGDTFVALRRQRNWTPEQEDFARRSLDKRLVLDRNYNRHINNWEEMLEFEQEYWGHKWALFKSKIWEAKQYVKQHG